MSENSREGADMIPGADSDMTAGDIAGTTLRVGESPVPLAAPERRRWWTKRKVITVVAITLVFILGACGFVAVSVGRFFAAEAGNLAEMRPFVDEAYPDYRVMDSTVTGFILQHEEYSALRLDTRFYRASDDPVWPGIPAESLGSGWMTHETFFRHADGLPEDPDNGMHYDVEGFVEVYEPLMPGPNAVVSAVWLEARDAQGFETYVVLVARRNRQGSYTESMWPDHVAYFVRDSVTGEWYGDEFVSLEEDDGPPVAPERDASEAQGAPVLDELQTAAYFALCAESGDPEALVTMLPADQVERFAAEIATIEGEPVELAGALFSERDNGLMLTVGVEYALAFRGSGADDAVRASCGPTYLLLTMEQTSSGWVVTSIDGQPAIIEVLRLSPAGRQCVENIADITAAAKGFRVRTDDLIAPDDQLALVPKFLDEVLLCPSGGVYTIADDGICTCSIHGTYP